MCGCSLFAEPISFVTSASEGRMKQASAVSCEAPSSTLDATTKARRATEKVVKMEQVMAV